RASTTQRGTQFGGSGMSREGREGREGWEKANRDARALVGSGVFTAPDRARETSRRCLPSRGALNDISESLRDTRRFWSAGTCHRFFVWRLVATRAARQVASKKKRRQVGALQSVWFRRRRFVDSTPDLALTTTSAVAALARGRG